MYFPYNNALIGLLALTYIPVGGDIPVQQPPRADIAQKQKKAETAQARISKKDQLRFFPGVIGTDDRIILESEEPPFTAIGRVNIAGYASRSACTGILVGPNTVLTASSCLRNKRTGRRALTDQIHFVANQKRDAIDDHAKAECVRYMPPTDSNISKKSPKQRTDIALIILEKNLSPIPAPITKKDTARIRASGD